MLLFAAFACRNDPWSVYARTFLRQAFQATFIVAPVALAESRNLTSAAMPAGCGRGSAHDDIQDGLAPTHLHLDLSKLGDDLLSQFLLSAWH